MAQTLDITFDATTQNNVWVTARWLEIDGERTNEIFVQVSSEFGTWSNLNDSDIMLDHLLNEWKMTTVGDFYRLHPDFSIWIYVDTESFETLRDRVIDLVRQDELDQITAKFAELTAKGE
jgi:hypothetical protein